MADPKDMEVNPSTPNTSASVPVPESQPEQPSPAAGGSKKGLWVSLAVAAVVVLGGAGWWYMQSNAKPAAKPISVKIGFMVPLSGDYTNGGLSAQQGFDLAKKTLHNENITVEVIKKSTNCDAASGAKAMNELVAEGVVAVVGELCSGGTLAAAPIANAHHIPIISMSATNPTISTAGDYVFRTVPSDALQADFVADYFYNKVKLHKIAILHTDETYATGLNDGVAAAFKKLGGDVVASVSLVKGTTDVTAALQQIQAANPDAIYMPTSSMDSAVAIVVKKKTLGMTMPLLGSESNKDRTLISDAAASAEGVLVVGVNDGTPAYYEQVQAADKVDPLIYSAQTYDAYTAIFKALEGGASTGEGIKSALYKENFAGVSGTIKFDANGDVAGNYNIYKVVDGKFVAQD
ncbi:MAG TPA: branched-chain amino acid ABC transporter substrate-binding protein [Patescibacteria group bacterium]|nr:branched-chain amino acid ABC transporter substrate-binding protein [Patescibacteria group bacterium]